MRVRVCAAVVTLAMVFPLSCARGGSGMSSFSADGISATGINGNVQQSTNVLMWKGDASGSGLYGNETVLNPGNVGAATFGKLAEHTVDGMILAQPLYLAGLNLGSKGTHDVVIVATEHDSIYAFDAADPNGVPLWERHYAINGAIPGVDDFGGRTTIGGEIGITGTPVIDPATDTMYFVTMLQVDGVTQQWLRAIDIRTGNDVGPGGVKIEATVPGDGVGSSNGIVTFDPTLHNQRAGLILSSGAVLIAWASFSDWGQYHGWLMAYDAATLKQRAVFTPTPQHQSTDSAYGPADFGGGGGMWQGGAIPSVDASGNIYIVASDGSFNANVGGQNYGDSVLKLRLNGNAFQMVDWFTPSDQACVDAADLEIGSGGMALLPSGNLGIVVSKEGRLFLLDTTSLGHYNAGGDSRIPQEFLAGNKACYDGVGPDHAEGADWNRLYGNPSFWNGNVYLAPANAPLKQYKLSGNLLNSIPAAQSPTATALRGGNTVVSAQGNQNGIVWMYEKAADGTAVLHAFDATNVSHELWNSRMNPRDVMGTGISFGTPVVADGRVFTTYNRTLVIYGVLQ